MRKPSGVQRRLRFPTPGATPPASREQRGSGRICSGVHEARSGRLLSRASPGWGCENLPTVPAPPLAPPQPRGRPAPWPCPRRPVVRAPPRTAPLSGCPAHPLRAAGLPSGPRGLRAAAQRLAPSRRSGTRPPRPLGNRLQGDRAPPPAPTPGTEPTCAGVCGVPVHPPHRARPAPPRPAQRRALSAWGDPGPGGAWGLGEEARSRGGPDPVGEAEAAGRSRDVILWSGLVHALLF